MDVGRGHPEGTRGLSEIDQALTSTLFGIVCVSPSHQGSPWLPFEGGVLARDLKASRITPLLVGLGPSDLTGALADLQVTQVNPVDCERLVQTLNSLLDDDQQLPREQVKRSFHMWRPELEEKLMPIERSISSQRQAGPERDIKDVLDVFVSTKPVQRQVERMVERMQRDRRTPTVVYAEADIRSLPDAPAEIALGDRDEVLDFATRLEDASEVWLLGKSLDTITDRHAATLEAFVARGGRLSALVLDCEDDVLVQASCRLFTASRTPTISAMR